MAEPEDLAETLDTIGASPGPSADSGVAAGMAIALGNARPGGKLPTEATEFLNEQTRLIRLQTEHLHEQRAVILSNLKLRRVNEWMKAALQALTMLVGLGVVIALAVMAWQAHEDHGVLVQPFSVPPDLAQRGLTGEVIASRLIDRLSELQTQTTSVRAASSYASDWGDDIKVEIPETGVSIGELNRWLRGWLGHETTISGEVYRTSTGIAVAAHAGTAPSTVHTGAEADLDDLVSQTAEDVYAVTQPYRHAAYLARRNPDQAVAAFETLTRTGDRMERMWGYNGLAALLHESGDQPGAIRAASSSIALDPKFGTPFTVRAVSLELLGQSEAALADFQRADELLHRYGARYMNRDGLAAQVLITDIQRAATVGDFSPAIREIPVEVSALVGRTMELQPDLAIDQARLHDVTAARQVEALLPPPSASIGRQMMAEERSAVVEAVISEELGNWPAVRNAYAGIDQGKLSIGVRLELAAELTPLAALARAKLGDVAGAEALIATTPLDCYLCIRARGQIEAVAHDWSGADRWFAEAVRQGPSLPFAHAEWGQSLLDEGSPDHAIAELKLAHQKSPHFADSLEVWGEALMAKRDYASAIPKFAAADKDAPKWGRNHLRWGEALMLAGRYAEARAQYQIASGLDLSVGDRAALNVLLAHTATGPLHG